MRQPRGMCILQGKFQEPFFGEPQNGLLFSLWFPCKTKPEKDPSKNSRAILRGRASALSFSCRVVGFVCAVASAYEVPL